MARRPPRSSISDDWEEVAEAASVRSVSSTPSVVDDEDDLLQFSESELPPRPAKKVAKSPVAQSNPTRVPPAPIPSIRETQVPTPTKQQTTVRSPSYKSPSVEDEPEGKVNDGSDVFDMSEIRKTVDTLRQEEPSSPIPIRPKKTVTAERDLEPQVPRVLRDDIPSRYSKALEDPFRDPAPEDSFKIPTPEEQPPRPNYGCYLDLEDRLGQRLIVAQGPPAPPRVSSSQLQSPVVDDDDTYDYTRDANHYYFTVKNMTENLGKAQSLAKELGSKHISTVQLVRSTCQDLAEVVKNLEPIYASYADYVARGAKSGLGGLPLNPSLLGWMESTTQLLAQIQDQFDLLRPAQQESGKKRGVTAGSIPFPVNCAIGNIGRGLQNALTTLKEFFPIIQADYNEFYLHMKLPAYPSNSPAVLEAKRYASSDMGQRRQELYDLKDQLQAIMLFLTEFRNTSAETRDSVPDVPKAIRDLVDLIEATTVILANNGTEWLDSNIGLSSKRAIAHQDYLSLDIEVLRGITEHLEDFHKQVDVASEPLFKEYSSTVIQNHQITILSEGGQMYNLLTTLSLLEAMLIVQD